MVWGAIWARKIGQCGCDVKPALGHNKKTALFVFRFGLFGALQSFGGVCSVLGDNIHWTNPSGSYNH